MTDKCFACGRPIINAHGYLVGCSDDQDVGVGPECYRKISRAGEHGYQPPQGGPRLYVLSVAFDLRRKASLKGYAPS